MEAPSIVVKTYDEQIIEIPRATALRSQVISLMLTEHETAMVALEHQSCREAVVRKIIDHLNGQGKIDSICLPESEVLELVEAAKFLDFNDLIFDLAREKGILHLLARNSHVDGLRCLIESKADVSAKDELGQTALCVARDVSVRNELLRAKLLAKGWTQLMIEADKGVSDKVKVLVDLTDVNVKNKAGRTALFYACKKAHVAVVDLLISARSDIDTVDKEGSTSLHLAAEKGHQEVVTALLAARAVVNAGSRPSCRGKEGHDNCPSKISSVMRAIKNGHFGVATTLIHAGANVHTCPRIKDPQAQPVMVAVKAGCASLVSALITAGADTNAVGSGLPLLDACRAGRADLAKILLHARADPAVAESPMHLAAGLCHAEVIEVLAAYGLSVNDHTMDVYGRSPLHIVAESSHWGTIYDRRRGEPRRARTQEEHKAAATAAARVLVRLGADVNAFSSSFWEVPCTPLMLAARNDSLGVLGVLLAAGADPRAVTESGGTAMDNVKSIKAREMLSRALAQLDKLEGADDGRGSGVS